MFIRLISLGSLALASSLSAEPVSFREQIAPVLLDHCLACHGPKKADGGYRIDSFDRIVKPGESDLATITGGKLDDSELYRRIISEDPDERMPHESDALPQDTIALFASWIKEGAKFDGKDSAANLAAIVPPPVHPDPPAAYRHTMPVTAVCFTPDGKQVIAGGYHELTVWNPEDGSLIKRIKNVGQRTFALALSPDGKTLAVGCGAPGQHGEARLFDLEKGELIRAIGMTSDVVLDVSFSPQGDRLAIAGADSLIRIFDIASGDEQRAISSHSDWIMAVAWDKEGKRLVSASRDKTAKVFDLEKGEVIVTYSGHGQPVAGVAFHPNGNEVYSSGADRKVQLWKIADGKKTADVTSFGGEAFKISVSGDFLFVPSADKSARQFKLADRAQVRSYAGHGDSVLSSSWHAATARLATGTFDGEVRIWNTDDGKQLAAFKAAPGFEAKP